jgi:hypothetical protein
VPYKTRLTGWLISYDKACSGEVEFRFAKKAHLAKNEGFGANSRTPLQFISCFIGFLEFGTYIGTYNPFRPVRLL